MNTTSEITLLTRFRDLGFVMRSLWLLVVFNLLAIFVFVGLPQGSDILLCVIEDFGKRQVMPIFAIIVAIFCWSLSSEFCTRFVLYMADNSGRTLSPKRVESRKKLQGDIAKAMLMLPSAIVTLGMLKSYYHFGMSDYGVDHLRFMLAILVLLIEAVVIWFLYNKKHPLFSYPGDEGTWLAKLYGIFNDYKVEIPDALWQCQPHTDPQPGEEDYRRYNQPDNKKLPQEFQLASTPTSADKGMWVAMFQIRPLFYKTLFKQYAIILAVSILLILVFAFLGNAYYEVIGSTALICVAFACWQVIYLSIHILDKTQPLPFKLPYKLILLVWFLICSIYGSDHEIRILAEKPNTEDRLELKTHFNAWLKNLDSNYQYGMTLDTFGTVTASAKTFPVFFIAAEGGALRTGAFTAMMLARIQDSMPAFKDHVYCMSGVSGGSLGLALFNSFYATPVDTTYKASKIFFNQDYLSAVIGKLVFAEIIGYFLPCHVQKFDRAIALEKGWEHGWAKADTALKDNVFSTSYDRFINPKYPALFINTTESETGFQCVWSNVKVDSLLYPEVRDLYGRSRYAVNYSTAINLSSRFPLISPGAALPYKCDKFKRHYVDAGYFENKGDHTLLEIIEKLNLKERTYINSTRLLLKLRTKLKEQYESNSDQERKVTVDFNTI